MSAGTATALEQQSDQSHAHDHSAWYTPKESNGAGKFFKLSPILTTAVILALGGIGAYYNSIVTESKMEVKITALEAGFVSLTTRVEKMTADVVPRSEHFATEEKQKEIDRLREKLADERWGYTKEILQLQRQIIDGRAH